MLQSLQQSLQSTQQAVLHSLQQSLQSLQHSNVWLIYHPYVKLISMQMHIKYIKSSLSMQIHIKYTLSELSMQIHTTPKLIA